MRCVIDQFETSNEFIQFLRRFKETRDISDDSMKAVFEAVTAQGNGIGIRNGGLVLIGEDKNIRPVFYSELRSIADKTIEILINALFDIRHQINGCDKTIPCNVCQAFGRK